MLKYPAGQALDGSMTENNGTKQSATLLEELNERSRTVFRELVETYLQTGEPVGSRTLSRALSLNLSAASIRNVMSDLEHMGLLTSPHTSAGRMPSDVGLRLFVDGLLEVGDLTEAERHNIESQVAAKGRNYSDVLGEAASMLSGLSHCAGLLTSIKSDAPLKHIEFVQTGAGQGLVIIVTENGLVENRVVDLPPGMTHSGLVEASNYLNAKLRGKTISEVRSEITQEFESQRAALDELSKTVVEAGLATWSEDKGDVLERTLIVRGHANLLGNVSARDDLERIRQLFEDLEGKNDLLQLLDKADEARGVQIFIGSESKLFSLSGSSIIAAPYRNSAQKVIGVVGVIGPTRLNYARVIPMVDFTAQVMSKILS